MQPHRSITQPSKDAKQRGAYKLVLGAWPGIEKRSKTKTPGGSSIASLRRRADDIIFFGDETYGGGMNDACGGFASMYQPLRLMIATPTHPHR